MKKCIGFVAAVLWAMGLVACVAGQGGEENSAGTEKTGEAEQLLCGSGFRMCFACGHSYCYDAEAGACPYCEIVGGRCECL